MSNAHTILTQSSTAILVGLLVAAAWCDTRSHRIPNGIVFLGALAGVLSSIAVPAADGAWTSLEGIGVGLGLLLPLYALRAIGAGDVKLMAMVGSFLGPRDVIGAIFFTFLVGGVMAVAVAMRHRAARRMLQNVWLILVGSTIKVASGSMPTVESVAEPVARMAYAIAVACGTVAFIAWQHLQG